MPATNAAGSYFPILEIVDRVCAEAFGIRLPKVQRERPELRFQLYIELLASFGDTPGFSEQDRLDASQCLTGEDRVLIASILSGAVKPTYAVTSYWSPLDRRRHSVYHRRPLAQPLVRAALAHAYAFFSLTLQGASATQNGEPDDYSPSRLYSATQFIARHAIHKVSPPICFAPSVPARPANTWWHIPETERDELLSVTGMNHIIDELLIKDSYSDDTLESGLTSTLVNSGHSRWLQVNDFPARAVAEFRRSYSTLSKHLIALADSTAVMLNAILKRPMTSEQALFMLTTYAIWCRACPGTSFAYTFPVLVADTCCVFTVGTDKALSERYLNFLAYLAKTLFIHPLIEDYSDKVQREERRASREQAARLVQTERNAFRQLLGHNLPKFLIRPAHQKVGALAALLRTETRGKQARANASAVRAAEDLQFLLEHYERFLKAFGSATSLEDLFRDGASRLLNFSDIQQSLQRMFDAFVVEAFPLEKLRSKVQVSWQVPNPFPLHIDKGLLEEVLLILLSNAVKAIDPLVMQKDIKRGIIFVRAYQEDQSGPCYVEVRDTGIGFAPDDLASRRRSFSELWAADQGHFWERVETQIDTNVKTAQKEDSLNIGLLFCAAFLRSLEWFHPSHRAGTLKIDSQEGSGTIVTIGIP